MFTPVEVEQCMCMTNDQINQIRSDKKYVHKIYQFFQVFSKETFDLLDMYIYCKLSECCYAVVDDKS